MSARGASLFPECRIRTTAAPSLPGLAPTVTVTVEASSLSVTVSAGSKDVMVMNDTWKLQGIRNKADAQDEK